MKTICSIIICLLLITACQDEPLSSMEKINDEWSEKNDENQQAQFVIDEIMKKYNAHSYQVTELQEGDPPRAVFILRDYQKQSIEEITIDDRARMAAAIATIGITQKDMAMLKDVDDIFTVVEEPPAPTVGMRAFYRYVTENLKYPRSAREQGIQGKVFVQFVVNDFGEITHVEAIKGIGGGCDEAAVEVVKNSPLWIPGKQRGEAVKVRMVIPIGFKLDDA